jgi:hypothetical protein
MLDRSTHGCVRGGITRINAMLGSRSNVCDSELDSEVAAMWRVRVTLHRNLCIVDGDIFRHFTSFGSTRKHPKAPEDGDEVEAQMGRSRLRYGSEGQGGR